MAARPRVVVIGAGVVGCALADELTERGGTDVTVLDQGPLFGAAGSTARAPGLVGQIAADRTLTEFAKYTVAKYASLTLAGQWCFQPVGGLEVATTPERLADLRRRLGWATASGVRGYLRSAAECAELHPLLDPEQVLGGLHTPGDSLVKPLRAAEAQTRRALGRGAKFLPHQRVTAIARHAGRVSAVVTEADRFRADVVVSCAGIWGPLVGRLVDLTVPLLPVVHQYVRTTPLAALTGDNDEYTEARRTLACLVSATLVLGKEPVYFDGRPVGYVTSAAYGYTGARTSRTPGCRSSVRDPADRWRSSTSANGFPRPWPGSRGSPPA